MEGSLTVGGDRFAQQEVTVEGGQKTWVRGSLLPWPCLLYTSDAADDIGQV